MDFLTKFFEGKNIQSLSGNVVYSALGFASFIILTRTLNTSDFGIWVIYTVATSFFNLFRFSFSQTATIRFLAGADSERSKELQGANFIISFSATLIIVSILWGFLYFSDLISNQSSFYLFFRWYPLLALSNLWWNCAIIILQAKQKFSTMLYIKSLSAGLFVVFLLINAISFRLRIEDILIVHIAINALISALTLIRGLDGFFYIPNTTFTAISTLLKFGKFTVLTNILNNLFKNSDTFIIGLYPLLGATGVAMFAIPFKFVELLDVILKSFSDTAFPRLSRVSASYNNKFIRKIFYTYTGTITFFLFPICLISFVYADELIFFLGGNEYVLQNQYLGNILRIFTVYGLFLPLDKLTSVMLDSMNKPQLNLQKVLLMLLINVIGDIIVVYLFNSLLAVALTTLIATILGIIFAWRLINKHITLSFSSLTSESYYYIKKIVSKIKEPLHKTF